MKLTTQLTAKVNRSEYDTFCVLSVKNNSGGTYRFTPSHVLRCLILWYVECYPLPIVDNVNRVELPSIPHVNSCQISARLEHQHAAAMHDIIYQQRLSIGRNSGISISSTLRRLIVSYNSNPILWQERIHDYLYTM